MSLINLKLAASESEPWKSWVLAKVGSAKIKLMRMDGRPYPNESHDEPEGLLVVDGQLNLTIGNEAITIHAGEFFVIPAGIAHAVAPGSAGTLIIFDT